MNLWACQTFTYLISFYCIFSEFTFQMLSPLPSSNPLLHSTWFHEGWPSLPRCPVIPLYWENLSSQNQRPLLPLMPDTAILCYICNCSHVSLHVCSPLPCLFSGGLVSIVHGNCQHFMHVCFLSRGVLNARDAQPLLTFKTAAMVSTDHLSKLICCPMKILSLRSQNDLPDWNLMILFEVWPFFSIIESISCVKTSFYYYNPNMGSTNMSFILKHSQFWMQSYNWEEWRRHLAFFFFF